VESVAALVWNGWQGCYGISGRNGVEYARKVLLPLSTANSESSESGLEGRRDLGTRGLQTPVTITTAGAPGLTKALAGIGPKALRSRCWLHQLPNLQQKVPPPAWPEVKA
jgi:putative transposase